MNKLYLFIISVLIMAEVFPVNAPGQCIINHNSTMLENVPISYIYNARQTIRMAYGHTSHGSQLVSGMELLRAKNDTLFAFNSGDASLFIDDYTPSGDLGNPDMVSWADRTRELLKNNSDNINTILWSWCGQVSSAGEENIDTYLFLMDSLEREFPEVRFIYMTGHLDGSGETGNLNLRNNQIRAFCNEKKKTLFDFADIESYDPDGNYFLDKNATDNCDYDGGNWATEWCNTHPGLCPDCECAHSQPLNCLQKGRAFWWMMARLAGWDGINSVGQSPDGENVCSVSTFAASGKININILLQAPSVVSVDILDIFGRELIKMADKQNFEANSMELTADIASVASGPAFAVVRINNTIYYKKVLITN